MRPATRLCSLRQRVWLTQPPRHGNFEARDLGHSAPNNAGSTGMNSPQTALQACHSSVGMRGVWMCGRGIRPLMDTSISSRCTQASSILHHSWQTRVFLIALNQLNAHMRFVAAAAHRPRRYCTPKSRRCALRVVVCGRRAERPSAPRIPILGLGWRVQELATFHDQHFRPGDGSLAVLGWFRAQKTKGGPGRNEKLFGWWTAWCIRSSFPAIRHAR
jgi:hypothetical protein